MRTNLPTILVALLLPGCATSPDATASPAPRDPGERPAAAAPVLRLLSLSPTPGSRVDPSAVLTATLAYDIPDFDDANDYVIAGVFAARSGGSFNRGGGSGPLRSPSGVVTVRHDLSTLLTGAGDAMAEPLTGSFFLLEMVGEPVVAGSAVLDERRQIRVRTARSLVRAQSRTFFYNGSGPARTFSRSIPDQLEEYWSYHPHKALAIARDPDGRWASGYGFGFATPDAARARALAECDASAQRRQVDAPCRLVVVDHQPVDGEASRAAPGDAGHPDDPPAPGTPEPAGRR